MKLKILNGDKRNFIQELTKFLNVRKNTQSKNLFMVKRIVNDVRSNGDKAIFKYEKKFTKIKKLNKKFTLSDGEVFKIIKKLNKETKKSIDIAFNRIEKFHKKQLFKSFKFRDKYQNEMSYRYTPIESVGVYVPGGRANYPSSVLMNCIPAKVAGVKKIFMTTPLYKTIPNPAVIYAAKKCGVKKIYKIGGAQAVAALAFGTKKIEKVNKIVGPGNSYVAGAKKEVFGEVGIDMIAGPSEVLIVSDKYSNPDWVASDLIAQAEHDEFSQSILVSSNRNLIAKVNKSLSFQLTSLPKKKIAITSLRNFGLAIYSKKTSRIIEIINEVAPEHLEIQLRDGKKILSKIKNAGSIFLGKYSPEAMGDYLAGPNHVLPTTGTAKFSSGLSVFDFLKRQSLIKITKRGIERLGASVINLAKHENLDGHANSVKMRLKKVN